MIVLEAINVGKRFKGTQDWAVQGFDVRIHKGEVFGLLGESGCGKTTILRMIAGFEKPSQGEIILNRQTVAGSNVFVEPQKRNVGIVFQDYALFPHKTVWENIMFGLFRLSKEDAAQRASKNIEICGLVGLENRYPHQLSGGQMQRVALARALAPEPQIILFDEPFSNIDSVRKYQIRDNIRDIIRATNATALFVTHDTKDVLAVADRVAVLKNGRIIQSDTPATLYSKPVNAYVADFFGRTNILKATATKDGYETALGFIRSEKLRPAVHTEVTLAIRPEDFEISNDIDACICGDVINQRFFGEFNEITCEVTGRHGDKTEVVIYASPQTVCAEKLCYFKPKPDSLNILE